ncbi:MAG TPA: PLD nuclease N-terminal domain-containing protein [bacterium]|nr:PLD nuclease N-terminal domain-containing protein [bacterium]
MISGFIGLLIFCADIYAILNIVKSSTLTQNKILWCLLVLVLPVIGLIIWYAAGPKSSSLR